MFSWGKELALMEKKVSRRAMQHFPPASKLAGQLQASRTTELENPLSVYKALGTEKGR